MSNVSAPIAMAFSRACRASSVRDASEQDDARCRAIEGDVRRIATGAAVRCEDLTVICALDDPIHNRAAADTGDLLSAGHGPQGLIAGHGGKEALSIPLNHLMATAYGGKRERNGHFETPSVD
jgi:hypothetical protein